jgi:DNA-directed RNA polymerase subunit RPC12/RpoP
LTNTFALYHNFSYYCNTAKCCIISSMFSQNIKAMNITCICPECKNIIDLSNYPNIAPGMVIECNHCGMTLLVKEIKDGEVKTEVVDEGK